MTLHGLAMLSPMTCFAISDGDLAMPSIKVRALRAGEPYHHLTAFTVRRSPY